MMILFVSTQFNFAGGGSIYSRFGLGDLYYFNNARQFGMGSIGTSLSTQSYININNPATISMKQLVRFEISLSYKRLNSKSASSSTINNDANLGTIAFAIPLQRDYGISMMFGLTPYSDVNYNVQEVHDTSKNYSLDHSGSGGLTKLFFGGSVNTGLGFALGATLDYYSGKITYKDGIEFTNASGLHDSFFESKSIYRGFGGTVGLMTDDLSEKIKISDKLSELRFGFNYSFSSNMNVDTTLSTNATLGLQSEVTGIYKQKLPTRFDIGFSFVYDENYLINFDYRNQDWSDFSQDNKINRLKNYSRIALGMEYNRHESTFSKFVKQIVYRCGISYEQSQFSVYGQELNQISAYAGLSVPLGPRSYFDIAFMYGQRGTTENNLLKENIFGASIGITIGELWFVRFEK